MSPKTILINTHTKAGISKAGSKTEKRVPAKSCHILPCRIKYNGEITDASKYFKITDVEDTTSSEVPPATESKKTTKLSHFRGRKLKGLSVPIPEGFTGMFSPSLTYKISPLS